MTELKQKLETKGDGPEPTTLASTEQLKALQAKYATAVKVDGRRASGK
jgi:hypothetical protein